MGKVLFLFRRDDTALRTDGIVSTVLSGVVAVVDGYHSIDLVSASSNLMWSFYVKIQVCWIVKHYKWTYFAFRSIFFHHSFGLLHQCLDLLVFGNDFFVTLERPKKLESSDEVSVSPMCEIQTFSCRNQINREQKPSSIWDNLNRPLVRMKSKKLNSMITWGKQGIYKSLQ